MTVRIEPWTEGDLPLLAQLVGDPVMMEHLGGAETHEQIVKRHARYLAGIERDPVFKVIDLGSGEAVGWVGYWEREWQEEQIYETGWSVIPAYQGRGIASAATALLIARARSAPKRRYLHAFPGVDNGPSNGICRKLGFTLLGAVEFEHPPGHVACSNDWQLDLFDEHDRRD